MSDCTLRCICGNHNLFFFKRLHPSFVNLIEIEYNKIIFVVYSDKSNTPSGFTLKLRKHIRTRRLEDVRQLGYDRV